MCSKNKECALMVMYKQTSFSRPLHKFLLRPTYSHFPCSFFLVFCICSLQTVCLPLLSRSCG
uniref:Uncharacterized protein n=1 Tax=Anguilla anguilla TaxID=7936 RepID=A0A0E9VLS4_ANGAN